MPMTSLFMWKGLDLSGVLVELVLYHELRRENDFLRGVDRRKIICVE